MTDEQQRFTFNDGSCDCGADHDSIVNISLATIVAAQELSEAGGTVDLVDMADVIQENAIKVGWIFDPNGELEQLRNYVADMDKLTDLEVTQEKKS